MCDHIEIIDDYGTGDSVCKLCGLVLDKLYLQNVNSKNIKEDMARSGNASIGSHDGVRSKIEVIDFMNMVNIHPSFEDEITINSEKLVKRFSHFPHSLIIASAAFVALGKSDYPLSITRLENYVCINKRDKKNLYRMVVSLNQPNIQCNLSENIAQGILQGLNLSFYDIKTIKKNIITLKCEFCTFSPLTVIAGHAYLYLKKVENSMSLANICLHLSVSKTSVYSYINSKRHKCVSSWEDVYNQLS